MFTGGRAVPGHWCPFTACRHFGLQVEPLHTPSHLFGQGSRSARIPTLPTSVFGLLSIYFAGHISLPNFVYLPGFIIFPSVVIALMATIAKPVMENITEFGHALDDVKIAPDSALGNALVRAMGRLWTLQS